MKKLILLSGVLICLSAQAEGVDLSDWHMPREPNRISAETYTGEQFDLNTWKSNIDHLVRPEVEERFKTIYMGSDRAYKLNPERMASVLAGLQEEKLVEVWNRIIARYPNSRNARSAFCQYAKELYRLNRSVTRCDKDFQLDPRTQFTIKPNLRATVAPKLP